MTDDGEKRTANSAEGAWIFVSHSHADLRKVREIRNYLEAKGHNPILFYLKCLDDSDARLPDLLRDEIKARNWFVLCDRSNARSSRYVNDEIALVQSMAGKAAETLYLESEIEPQLHKLDRLLKRATVYISHAYQDREIAEKIGKELRERDFKVWADRTIDLGSPWAREVQVRLDKAIEEGYVLLLLSDTSLNSEFCRAETQYALHLAGRRGKNNVIPIIVDDAVRYRLPEELNRIQWFDMTGGAIEHRINDLIVSLMTRAID